MRIPSGVTDQYIYFKMVDSTDHITPETGLASFSAYRSRNGGAATAFTTPTVNEVDATNLPGWYELLLDEDMTIDAGDDSQEMLISLQHAGADDADRVIELYRPKITAGNTLSVESDGDLTKVNTLDGHTAQTGDAFARLGAPAGASVSADMAAVKAETAAILDDTDLIDDGTSGLAKIAADVAAILVDTAVIGAAGAGLTEAGGTGDHLTALATAAALATVDTVVDAIKAKTDSLTFTVAGHLDVNLLLWNGVAPRDLIAQRVNVSVGSMAADVITASAAASDFGTEIATSVWASAARTLTAIDEDNTTLDLDGTIRAALGLASANLDTQLGDLPTTAELATALGTADDAVLAEVALVKAKTDLIPGTADGYTWAQREILMASVLLGKNSGWAGVPSTISFRSLDDAKDRVSASVDALGNRLSVTLDPS